MSYKILFVCLGNICRSPLAEGIMRKLIVDNNLAIEVDSAGTSSFHIGEAPDKRTMNNAKKHQVDLSHLCARQFTAFDFDKFDKIYVMDKTNLSNVLSLTTDQYQQQKIELFLNELYPKQNKEVPDPYFGGEKGFEDVFQMTYDTCKLICDKITKTV